ncbi:MAG: DMT family transporter [Desulfurococcaceae archaeon]
MKRYDGTLLLVFLLIVAWLAISSASVIVVLSGASPEACAFWRLTFSIPFLFVLGSLSKSGFSGLASFKIQHLVAGIALSLHFTLWMRSLLMIPIFISTLLVTLYPLYSFVIEILVFKRRISMYQLVGLLISTLLLSIYLGVSELVFNIGVMYALLAGFLVAIYFIAGFHARYYVGEPLISYAIKTYLIASLVTLITALINNSRILYLEIDKYVFFVLLALIPMMLGHTLMNYLLSIYPASIVTSISYGEPFGAGLLAYILLGQELSSYHFIFGVLIITSVFITVVLTKRYNRMET